jgi:hypothetical protein
MGVPRPRLRCGRCWLWSRAGARYQSFDQPVSPARIPEPGVRVSTHRALHGPVIDGRVGVRLRSTLTVLTHDRHAGIHRRLLPCQSAAAGPLCPFACDRLSRPPTTTGTPPRPATSSGRRACPPPEGGEGGHGSRFPRSPPPGRRVRCPAMPRQPRQGYAAGLPPGLLTGHYPPATESLAATATGVRC